MKHTNFVQIFQLQFTFFLVKLWFQLCLKIYITFQWNLFSVKKKTWIIFQRNFHSPNANKTQKPVDEGCCFRGHDPTKTERISFETQSLYLNKICHALCIYNCDKDIEVDSVYLSLPLCLGEEKWSHGALVRPVDRHLHSRINITLYTPLIPSIRTIFFFFCFVLILTGFDHLHCSMREWMFNWHLEFARKC